MRKSISLRKEGKRLGERVGRLAESITELGCDAEFHFKDHLVKMPIRTKDNHLIEAAFCCGYKELKYMAALSAQIGCPVKCKFCGAGERYVRNLTSRELFEEAVLTISTAAKRGYDLNSRPTKIAFVTGGEPLLNGHFPEGLALMGEQLPLQMKISTIAPETSLSGKVFDGIVDAARNYPNIVQFQISLNSTDENYRRDLCSFPLASFQQIRRMGEIWFCEVPKPRKIDLTFTLNGKTPIKVEDIKDILPPELFAIRLRGYVPSRVGDENGFMVMDGEGIKKISRGFGDAGYQLIPGMAGKIELDFKLSPAEILETFRGMKKTS